MKKTLSESLLPSTMPREFQKKRRKANKDGLSTAQDDKPAAVPIIERAKPTLPDSIPEAQSRAFGRQAAVAAAIDGGSSGEWPMLDPDTKAYWKQIEGRILELEQLGIADATNEEEDEEDGGFRCSRARSCAKGTV